MKMNVNTFCHAGTDGYGVRMRDGRHGIKDDEREVTLVQRDLLTLQVCGIYFPAMLDMILYHKCKIIIQLMYQKEIKILFEMQCDYLQVQCVGVLVTTASLPGH
jgi:hypothetical protein